LNTSTSVEGKHHFHGTLTDLLLYTRAAAGCNEGTMKQKFSISRIALYGLASLAFLGLGSCLPLAAGAAAGYIARDEGYRVQSPIKKTE
jgi:hypothetical protein